jgi:putative ABC transport system ATP-binding protein
MFSFLRCKRSAAKLNGFHRPGASEHLIDIRNVVKTFENAAGVFTALKGINLTIDAGEFVSIVGKSGSGKSTLINMITGIDKPTSGEVWVDQAPVHELSEEQIAIWRGATIGIVFQFFQLLPTLTSVENVLLPMDYNRSLTQSLRPDRAMMLLQQMGMTDYAHQIPTLLSGGQQQVIAIARALANDPPILVADEPTGNLDSKTAEAVFTLFETLAKKGKTIVMVTHDNDLANRTARKIVIADGVVVAQGK